MEKDNGKPTAVQIDQKYTELYTRMPLGVMNYKKIGKVGTIEHELVDARRIASYLWRDFRMMLPLQRMI